ncbi:MAG TPA: N-acetylglucosamine-6-phosphate deacetylase [Clostridiales bacterium]|nr:N-acetylglucosamine-6-phosphate deacetylase [Clostridiales bacterium]
MLIKNARIVTYDKVISGDILIKNKKIAEIGEDLTADCETIDACQNYVIPGFVDIHVHGGGGYSAMGPTPEDIVNMANAHAKHGTLAIMPTTLTAPTEQLLTAINAVSQAKNLDCDAEILGIHLEGPFISPEKKGAQSEDDIKLPTKENVEVLLNASADICIMGIAPEIEGAFELAKLLKGKNIVASMAHTDATYETATEALNHGFSDITHIYNGMTSLHKEGMFRVAGVAEAGIVGDCTAQMIGDLRHLPEGIVKIIYRAKGADMCYCITDGLEFSAMDLSENTEVMQKNGQAAKIYNGVMVLADMSCLAGSVVTMHDCFKNMLKIGITIVDAVKMCSTTPARVAGFGDRLGQIKPDFDAGLLILDNDYNISKIII